MDAAELYVSTLDMCEICGRIVEQGALHEAGCCGLRYCDNCINICCKCPITVDNEEDFAFMTSGDQDVEIILADGDEEEE